MGCSNPPPPSGPRGGGQSTPSVFSSSFSVAKGDFRPAFAFWLVEEHDTECGDAAFAVRPSACLLKHRMLDVGIEDAVVLQVLDLPVVQRRAFVPCRGSRGSTGRASVAWWSGVGGSQVQEGAAPRWRTGSSGSGCGCGCGK